MTTTPLLGDCFLPNVVSIVRTFNAAIPVRGHPSSGGRLISAAFAQVNIIERCHAFEPRERPKNVLAGLWNQAFGAAPVEECEECIVGRLVPGEP